MSRIVLLLVAFIALAHGSAIKNIVPLPDGRIVGGEETNIALYPHQVSVRYISSHICGGSILSETVVISAAHCIMGSSFHSIQYGVTKVGGSTNVIKAVKTLKHEQYDSNIIDYDISLLFLASAIPLGENAKIINLAKSVPAVGTPATVSGWGTTTEGGSSSSLLQKVDVKIVSTADCSNQYSGINDITSRMLCAGVVNGGKDACQGDSGGPLIADNELVGIVSWGVGCARSDYAGVYTNVANLIDWVDQNAS